jgi:hypothetical protein
VTPDIIQDIIHHLTPSLVCRSPRTRRTHLLCVRAVNSVPGGPLACRHQRHRATARQQCARPPCPCPRPRPGPRLKPARRSGGIVSGKRGAMGTCFSAPAPPPPPARSGTAPHGAPCRAREAWGALAAAPSAAAAPGLRVQWGCDTPAPGEGPDEGAPLRQKAAANGAAAAAGAGGGSGGIVRSISLRRLSSTSRADLELQLLGQVRAAGVAPGSPQA